jgi:enoyl-CoA hydratase
MDLKNLLYEVQDNIAVLTFNRPKVLNALDAETMLEFSRVIHDVRQNADLKALILTGTGEKSFIAGADISGFPAMTGVGGKDFALLGQAVLTRMENLSIPVVAAVNGFALGGGLEVALACHLRIFAENAKVGLPEVTLGIIPGYGGTQRLPRVVGKGVALQMILTGKPIDAAEAYRIGLANQVVPPGEALEAAKKLVGKILNNGPVALKMALEAVNHGLNMTLDEGLRLEAALFGAVCSTEDKNEGAKAFMEKRPPQYQGK